MEDSKKIEQLEAELSKLQARVTGVESEMRDGHDKLEVRVTQVETRVAGVENKVELFKVDLANQSRWLQEISLKVDVVGRTADGVKQLAETMSTESKDLRKVLNQVADELMKNHQRDTIPAPGLPPETEEHTPDIHEEVTVTDVPRPTRPPPSKPE